MEVDGVRAKDKGLTNMSELNAIDATGCGFITRRVADNDSTILVVGRVHWVASENNVAGQEADLSTHLDCFGAESLDASVMFSEERSIKSDDRVAVNARDRFNRALLSITA